MASVECLFYILLRLVSLPKTKNRTLMFETVFTTETGELEGEV